MNDYEAKQEAKKERYKELAEKNRQESERRFDTASEIGRAIPFGQPILVGHHSERGHRADLKRIDNNMRKSVEASDKGAYYERKAKSVGKGGISSDDPEALSKLRDKLGRMKHNQETMKAANRAIRLKDKAEGDKRLIDLGYKAVDIQNLRTPDCMGNVGFPSYSLSNNNGNMRRVRQRIEQLEARQGEVTETFKHGDIDLVYNVEENRVQLLFDGKPAEHIRTKLKSSGFRWSRNNMAWQRQLTNNGKWAAKNVLSYIEES